MNKLNLLLNDKRGQISVEYLVLIIFGIMLVIISGIVVINLNSLLGVARSKILTYRDNILSSL